MKRCFFITLLGLIASLIAICSCDKQKQYYTQTFYRFATVRQSLFKGVWLDFDCSNEEVTLMNFRKAEDLATFNVHNGSRVFAKIYLNVEENSKNTGYTLVSLDTLGCSPLDTIEFKNSIGIYFYMFGLDVGYDYPSVWAADNYLNLSFAFFPNKDGAGTTKFYLSPENMREDTLRLRLFSLNADTAIADNAESRLQSYDIRSLNTLSSNDPDYQNRLDSIISALNGLIGDSICIEVATPDSLHIFDPKLHGTGGWRGIKGTYRRVMMKNYFN